MTDKHPEALRLADELEEPLCDFPDPTTLEAEAAAELRRLHAENQALRAKLNTYEDLGDAGSDVQLLRMGYAAARLEIESLRKEHADELAVAYMCGASREKELAAPQVAAYAAQDSEHQLAIMEGERNASLDAYSRVVSITSAESRLYERAFTSGWDRRDRLASYGQAPAQAAPAAVAGPSGYGPKVTVKRRCSDCKACNSESYAVQGDSGHYVYCEHPSLPERKYIGDTNWNTPHWCPVSAPTTQPAPQQGEGRNLQAVINAAADKLDAAKRCHQSAVDTLIDEALEILDGDRDPHKPAPQQEAQEPILYDPKALLEVFQNAQAGSSCPAGTLRGIAAVIASWESREPHTLIAAPQPSPAAQGDARSMLRIVADYSDWLDSKGRLTSFSTFVNEFGYEERDCKSVYEIVVVPCLAARAAQEDKKP